MRTSGILAAPLSTVPAPKSNQYDSYALAMRIWGESWDAKDTLVDRYLTSRGLTRFRPYDILRFHPSLYHAESKTRGPAMVAMLQSAAHGRHVAIHRTWLAEPGIKSNVKPVRKALGPVLGHTVRLTFGGTTVILGEGLESTFAAMQLFGKPGFYGGWATLSATGLASVILPVHINTVLIAADHDPAGLNAAYTAAARLRTEGRKVDIAVPPKAGTDFNDVLLEGWRP
jgi:hypothetical protein